MLNLVLDLFTKPNRTFQTVIKKDTFQTSIFIVLAFSVSAALISVNLEDLIIAISVLPFSFMTAYVSSWFSRKFLNGKGDFRKTYVVWSFATIPILLSQIIGVIYVLLLRGNLTAYTISSIIYIIGVIWTLILDIKGFSIAHKVNLWKSLAANILAVILYLPIMAVIMLLF